MRVLSIFGTRPEAIKMAPLIRHMQNDAGIESILCVTGQHRHMLDPLLALFDLRPDYDLAVMRPNQTLNRLTSTIIANIDEVLDAAAPDCVLVHGDTTSAMASAVGAFHRGIAVGHVEAGLRTGNISQPFPEEMNRRVVDTISTYLFAPTATSESNLLQENLPGRIWVTGNTVIDALASICSKLRDDPSLSTMLEKRHEWLDPQRPMLLVTGHRRENFGEGLLNICQALAGLAQATDLQIVYPVHLNPNVLEPVKSLLGSLPNIHLLEPLDYLDFVWFMQRAHIILTDSGGIQEEAPYLGKPVLVMRDVTERPEAVKAGTAMMVGTDPKHIVECVQRLMNNAELYSRFGKQVNPYGDGKASERITSVLCGRPIEKFSINTPPRHASSAVNAL